MVFKFYSDWFHLEKLKVGLLCAIAEHGGEYHGSVRELYRKTRINPPKRVGTTQLEDAGHALFELQEDLYIKKTELTEYTSKIEIIKRGEEYKIPEKLYNLIKKKHKNGIGWQNVIKLLLFLLSTELLETNNFVLMNVIQFGSKKLVSSSKKVLSDLGCLYTKNKWKVYEDKDGKKGFDYQFQYMKCSIPITYYDEEDRKDIECNY